VHALARAALALVRVVLTARVGILDGFTQARSTRVEQLETLDAQSANGIVDNELDIARSAAPHRICSRHTLGSKPSNFSVGSLAKTFGLDERRLQPSQFSLSSLKVGRTGMKHLVGVGMMQPQRAHPRGEEIRQVVGLGRPAVTAGMAYLVAEAAGLVRAAEQNVDAQNSLGAAHRMPTLSTSATAQQCTHSRMQAD
jgi:hypothetical protein